MNALDLEELDRNSLQKILKLVHQLTGITMGENKKRMLQGRLRPRMRIIGTNTYEQYLDYLDSHKSEIQEFINLVTTNETSFFRTQRVWDFFIKEFLAAWSVSSSQQTLKIWSGASSSGEEIYTIAICCEEHRQKNPEFNYQILGTDISTEVLAVAEKGIYSGRSIEAFKTTNRTLFDKYLVPVDDAFRIKPELKANIRFHTHNLYHIPAMKNHYDIVFLRNVLIYFEASDQEKVLGNMGSSLVDGGYLIIGESESLASLKTPFKYIQPLVHKKGEGSPGK